MDQKPNVWVAEPVKLWGQYAWPNNETPAEEEDGEVVAYPLVQIGELITERQRDLKEAPVPLVYDRGWVSLERAVEMWEVHSLVARYGTWAVTTYGVECLSTHYPIPKDRLQNDWLRHMQTKRWVEFRDFAAAIDAGRQYHKTPPYVPPAHVGAGWEPRPHVPVMPRNPRARRSLSVRVRFLVLKRDGYRCKLCGRSAQDGVTLQIDHIVAVAKGGTDALENLQTACWDCNQGKRTDDL